VAGGAGQLMRRIEPHLSMTPGAASLDRQGCVGGNGDWGRGGKRLGVFGLATGQGQEKYGAQDERSFHDLDTLP